MNNVLSLQGTTDPNAQFTIEAKSKKKGHTKTYVCGFHFTYICVKL